MINLTFNSNSAYFGSFDSFTVTSTACTSMLWLLLRVHEADSVLSTTCPYLCTVSDRFSENTPAILVQSLNKVFRNPVIYIYLYHGSRDMVQIKVIFSKIKYIQLKIFPHNNIRRILKIRKICTQQRAVAHKKSIKCLKQCLFFAKKVLK